MRLSELHMTVGDLIDILKDVDHMLPVVVLAEYDCGYCTAGGYVTDYDINADKIVLKSED